MYTVVHLVVGRVPRLLSCCDGASPLSWSLSLPAWGGCQVRDANAPPAASGKDLERGQVARKGRQPGARFALVVLTSINLLNYVDR